MSKRTFGPFAAAFDTARLRVFRIDVVPTPHNEGRCTFIAFRTDEDRPLVCATAVVWETAKYGKMNIHAPSIGWVDWIEVTSLYRKQGFGRELLEGIEKHLGGELEISGATPEGEAFCDAISESESGEWP